MPTEAIGAMAPEPTEAIHSTMFMGSNMDVNFGDDVDCPYELDNGSKSHGLHSPPDSNNATKLDGSDSELSDIEDLVEDQLRDELPKSEPQPEATAAEEEDIGEVLPAEWSGTVPVFKPTMHQFRDFKRFMEKIDSYGMKSGIVKIVPPAEWKQNLPSLDDMVKQIRVREPIKQEIMGSNGTYRQVNILHQRSYNIPQWRSLCDQSEHQPPARRGERRAQAEKPKPAPRATRATRAAAGTAPAKAKAAPKKRRGRFGRKLKDEDVEPEDRPMTPVSPGPDDDKPVNTVEEPSIKEEDMDEEEDYTPVVRRMGGVRQPASNKTQSVSARRKYSKREGSAKIDEAAFKDFDYNMDISDYTPERCEELEKTYWKTLTYAPPLYGADLMGTLFDESTELWNLNKLPNLLDVLGTKVPGVNTAYLYLGMWKATFAWHLEDVDLYSINYLHFGAPKQWYSISQADARRFEAAMKSIWPTEAKACDQFLRHKAFLISPTHLKQYYNITVNKVVSYPGEFVVTYPYGYHSGYNLGYNCAEAVNFALDSWLPMGKIAKRCECAEAQDSVWIDVYEIERKLRGESTEYEETEDEEDEEEDDEDNETGLPSPPSSHTVRIKRVTKKRKRPQDKELKTRKKIRLRIKSTVEPPCCLCPNDIPGAEIIPTDDGRKAHRMCALYVPETYIETVDGKEIAANVANIDKARLDLKCLYCRSKRGACFQCSQKKCARSYHATCAAAAGVFVEEEDVPVFGEDGTEYKEQAFEFSCRFHRTKRDKKLDAEALDTNSKIRDAAAALKKNDICQMQYFRGDIFAGVVVENRVDEQTLLLDIIPNGYVGRISIIDSALTKNNSDRVEVEWKWLLLPDAADLRLTKASPNALPLPTTRKAKQELNAKKRPEDELPRKDDVFGEGFTWAEFHTCEEFQNPVQAKVDFSKDTQVWHYLGKTSTETKPQYTEDMARPLHNTKSNFLDSVPKPVVVTRPQLPAQHRASFSVASYPRQQAMAPPAAPGIKVEDRPYAYKPRKSSMHAAPGRPEVPIAAASAPGYQHLAPSGHGQNHGGPQAGNPQHAQRAQYAPHAQHAQPMYQQFQAKQQQPSSSVWVWPQAQVQPQQAQTQGRAQQAQGPGQGQPQRQAQPQPQPGQFTPQQFRPKAVPPPVSPVNQQLVANQQRAAAMQQQQQRTPQTQPQTPVTPVSQSQPQQQQQQQQRTPSTAGTQYQYQAHQSQPQRQQAQPSQPAQLAHSSQPPQVQPRPQPQQPQHQQQASPEQPQQLQQQTQKLPQQSKQPTQQQKQPTQQQQKQATPGRPKASSFGTAPRNKGSATHFPSSDRFASVGGSNGFPQLPGLTWPPAHMKSGQYSQPQTRVWPTANANAGPRPPDNRVPMTSSDLEPTSPKLGNSVSVNVTSHSQQPVHAYQKYSFFQVNHNRDASTYRTPYNLWGGFTNGYEGNLKAFLRKAQKSLSGGKAIVNKSDVLPRLKQLLPAPNGGQLPNNLTGANNGNSNTLHPHTLAPNPYSSPYAQHSVPSPTLYRANSIRGDTPISPSPYTATPYSPILSTPAMWDVRQPSPTPLHPAIRPQYMNSWQSDLGEQTYGPHNFNPHLYPQQNHGHQHFNQHVFPQQHSYVSSQYTPNLKPRSIAPYNPAAAPSSAPSRAPAFNKQSFSPIPLPPYVKRALSTSSAGRGSSPSSLLAQHSSTLTSEPTPLSRHAVSQGGGPPSPPAHQQQHQNGVVGGGGYAMQRNQSDQGSFHEDNFFNFSAMDSGSGNEGSSDNNNNNVKSEPQHMQYQHDYHQSSFEFADVSTESSALVENIMADLRRASASTATGTGGGTGGGGAMISGMDSRL